jgi:hypothetical protein
MLSILCWRCHVLSNRFIKRIYFIEQNRSFWLNCWTQFAEKLNVIEYSWWITIYLVNCILRTLNTEYTSSIIMGKINNVVFHTLSLTLILTKHIDNNSNNMNINTWKRKLLKDHLGTIVMLVPLVDAVVQWSGKQYQGRDQFYLLYSSFRIRPSRYNINVLVSWSM